MAFVRDLDIGDRVYILRPVYIEQYKGTFTKGHIFTIRKINGSKYYLEDKDGYKIIVDININNDIICHIDGKYFLPLL
jgi:hypothetical protein